MPRNNDSRSGITRRQAIAGGASVSAALLLAGCADDPDLADDDGTGGNGGNGGNGGSDDGGVVDQLNVTQQVAPVEWDPIVLNDAYSEQIIHTVYDGLYEYDVQTLDPQPKIAAAEPEIERDGTRFIVPLREEPEFHDGTPVTAEDVVHTFMAPIEEQTDNMPDVAMIESAEALDDHTVQFDLEFPYGAFAEMTLARNVVHAEARQEDPEAYNTENPIGSGPYQFDDAVIGEFADVTLWEDYWDEPSQIPSIRWEPAEDDAGRVSRMLARETDVMEGIPPADWEDIDAEDGITIEDTPDTGVFYLAFNCNEGPTADPDVRRAIAHCHSTGAYVDDVIGEAGQNINYPVAPTIAEEWDFPVDEWNDMEYEFDPDYARELLDGSDAIEEGEEIHFISPPDDLRQQWCELVADRLNEIGYGGTVERLPVPDPVSVAHRSGRVRPRRRRVGPTAGVHPRGPAAYVRPRLPRRERGAPGRHGRKQGRRGVLPRRPPGRGGGNARRGGVSVDRRPGVGRRTGARHRARRGTERLRHGPPAVRASRGRRRRLTLRGLSPPPRGRDLNAPSPESAAPDHRRNQRIRIVVDAVFRGSVPRKALISWSPRGSGSYVVRSPDRFTRPFQTCSYSRLSPARSSSVRPPVGS